MRAPSFNKTISIIFTLVFFITIALIFKKFYIDKDYTFILEASCDSSVEICYERDCSVEGDCPPNNLSEYKVYEISASDFDKCNNVGCKDECEQGIIQCKHITCGESGGDICSK